MKKKSSLGKKLKQYSTFAGVVIASSAAHGQIIYTDVNPDVVLDADNPSFSLNFNNPLDCEFELIADFDGINNSYFSFYITNCSSGYSQRIITYPPGNGGGEVVTPLPYGYEIQGDVYRWRSRGFFAHHLQGGQTNDTSYPWANKEAYVGLKYNAGFDESGIHFAWVRVAVNSDPTHPTITIKDYAYNSVTHQKIGAGEGSPQVVCTDSYEPNNIFSQATVLGTGQPVLSMINPAHDRDFYQFTVSGNQSNVRVVLSNLPKNYDMKLFDASKQLIETAKNKKKENDTIIYNNAAAGTYYVKVYQKDNAFDASACYSLVAETSSSPFKISSTQHVNAVEVNLFPNPAGELLTVEFDDELQADASVSIFDLEGKEVMTTIFPAGVATSQLNISSLAPGMYLLKAIAGNQVVMKKFSVVK